ncbi:hypothetical protein [Nocardia abscessus]|uniref:hypothetical protein n=1 Tax=Nocardia abscessus TaxID=120957 RepID=UPI0024551D57|nr:hypothetical protein [Nocardia abscessus]
MTENGQTYIAQWIASLLKSAKRHSIVFVSLGSGFDQIRETCEKCVPANLAVENYLAGELVNCTSRCEGCYPTDNASW